MQRVAILSLSFRLNLRFFYFSMNLNDDERIYKKEIKGLMLKIYNVLLYFWKFMDQYCRVKFE